MACLIEKLDQPPIRRHRVEVVERKGIGHPDSICDAVMEQASLALCREYIGKFGRILHHNLDKGLLVAGRTEPALGGGHVVEPMKLVLGDRATSEFRGQGVDVGRISEKAVSDWIRSNLRFVDPGLHLVFQNELKPGSEELADIFARDVTGANDTSAAVGYAPMSETELLVLAAERFLNNPDFKKTFPEAGEDVKVMGYRLDRILNLTVAIAFVDRFVPDAKAYFIHKREIQIALEAFLGKSLVGMDSVTVEINSLDDPARGNGGMYLTVLGTSAEGGDCGAVGRGNKVNGVISMSRPMSMEAVAGKNPVSHVGKIYSLLTHEVAKEIHRDIPGVEEVYVWLGSRIGRPVGEPALSSIQLIPAPGAELGDVEKPARDILEGRLADIGSFINRVVRGEFAVC